MEIPNVIQDLLFSRIWTMHNKVDGIHPEFGRVSYLNSQEISEYYWTNNEQRVELIMTLTSLLSAGDDALVPPYQK